MYERMCTADSPTEQASSIIKFKRTPVSSVKSKAQVSKSPTRSKKRSNKSLTSLKSKQSVQSTKLNRNKRVTSDGEFQTYLGDSVAGCRYYLNVFMHVCMYVCMYLL